MKKLSIPSDIEEKIYDIKINDDEILSTITTYFPLNYNEKQAILEAINTKSSVDFKSIFSDKVSENEWNETKEQIKKKFQDELIDIN